MRSIQVRGVMRANRFAVALHRAPALAPRRPVRGENRRDFAGGAVLCRTGRNPGACTETPHVPFRVLVSLLVAVPAFARSGTHQVKLNGHTFTLPDGFTIELAAGADLAPRPIVAAFDEKGRLYVTDSSGSNEKVDGAGEEEAAPHPAARRHQRRRQVRQVRRSSSKNVMFPEGAMWLNGSLYVAAPPHIWKFTDTDDDGVADKEEIWFDGKTLTGCANDLHGPYLGPDGWIYWMQGRVREAGVHAPTGKPFRHAGRAHLPRAARRHAASNR